MATYNSNEWAYSTSLPNGIPSPMSALAQNAGLYRFRCTLPQIATINNGDTVQLCRVPEGYTFAFMVFGQGTWLWMDIGTVADPQFFVATDSPAAPSSPYTLGRVYVQTPGKSTAPLAAPTDVIGTYRGSSGPVAATPPTVYDLYFSFGS